MDSPGRQRRELRLQAHGSQIQTDTLTLEACFFEYSPSTLFLAADTPSALSNDFVILRSVPVDSLADRLIKATIHHLSTTRPIVLVVDQHVSYHRA